MMFKAKNISKTYGSITALSEVSVSCLQGEICGLIGANGAGKSTLFRIILGLIKQDSGEVEIQSTAPKPIGGIVEKPALYEYLNAYGNLKVFAQMQGLKMGYNQYQESMKQVGLSPDRKDAVKHFSLGMKQRLGLAIALLNKPDCLVLDEPFSGLDPMGIYSFHELIRSLSRKHKITVLISSHIIDVLTSLCDSIYVLNKGKVIRHGRAEELSRTSVTSFKILGTAFPETNLLERFAPLQVPGGYLIQSTQNEISGVLGSLISSGAEITACIPQTDLNLLFDED